MSWFASDCAFADARLRLELRELVTMVVNSHPTVQAQQSLVGAALDNVSNARWQYFPTPSISVQGAQASGSDPAYSGDSRVAVLALTQPLWTGGRIEAGVDKAQAYAQSARASLSESQQQLAIRVVQAYGDWLSAHRKRAAYQVGLDQHIRLKDQVARRIHEGQAAASDLALAQSRIASLEADMAMAHTQEQVSLSRLSQLLGQPVLSTSLASTPAHAWPIALGDDELLNKAQAFSPTLVRARSNAQAQLATIAEQNRGHQFVVFRNNETGDDLTPAAPGFRTVATGIDAASRPRRILYEQTGFIREAMAAGIDVMFNPGFTSPYLLPRPNVTLIHDLQHHRHPEFFKWSDLQAYAGARARRGHALPRGVQRVDGVEAG